MEERQREGLIKELKRLKGNVGDSIGHFKKLRKEIKSSIKHLQRRRKLPEDVEDEFDKIDGGILSSFFKAYLSLLNRVGENIKDGLEELEKREEKKISSFSN